VMDREIYVDGRPSGWKTTVTDHGAGSSDGMD